MTIQFMRKCVSMAAIGVSLASVPLEAACTDGTGSNLSEYALKYFNGKIGNSDDRALVNAYRNGQCTITQGVHGGGDPCPNGSNIKSHITVQILPNGPTCHVFAEVTRNGGICTTCR